MFKDSQLQIQTLSPGPGTKKTGSCSRAVCQFPIVASCPGIPQLQSIQTLNSLPQSTSEFLDNVDLGTLQFTTGSALTYLSPNIIQINTPGLYQVNYSAGVLLSSSTDYLFILPVYNDQFRTSAALQFSNQDGFVISLLAKNTTFYVANNSSATLQFLYITTSPNNFFDDFTVTVMKVQ